MESEREINKKLLIAETSNDIFYLERKTKYGISAFTVTGEELAQLNKFAIERSRQQN